MQWTGLSTVLARLPGAICGSRNRRSRRALASSAPDSLNPAKPWAITMRTLTWRMLRDTGRGV